MNILLLVAVLFPIPVLALRSSLRPAILRWLALAATLPMIALALERWFYWAQHRTLSDGRVISILIILLSATFVYGWLRPYSSFSSRPSILLLLVTFVVLLQRHVSSIPAVVLLANLPALLVHRLSPHSADNEARQHVFIFHRLPRFSSDLVVPTSILAAFSVLAAIFIHARAQQSPSFVSGAALGVVVAVLIWQILLLLMSGQPTSRADGIKSAQNSGNLTWLLQRQIRLASVLAVCLSLFYLRFAIQRSLFASSIMVVLSSSTLMVTGALMLMERSVLRILSLMEYFWIAVLLAAFCIPERHSAVLLGAILISLAIEMAADCWITSLLSASIGTHLDLDSIIGWRFSHPWTATCLGILILVMQFLPAMPAFHFLIIILSALFVHHEWLAILILTVNGSMLTTAFRLLGAMYSKPCNSKT
jgi:hypothetical protein